MTFTGSVPQFSAGAGRSMLRPNIGPHHTDLATIRQRFSHPSNRISSEERNATIVLVPACRPPAILAWPRSDRSGDTAVFRSQRLHRSRDVGAGALAGKRNPPACLHDLVGDPGRHQRTALPANLAGILLQETPG